MTALLDAECQALGQHQLIWDGHALCCTDLRWLQRMGAPVPHVAGHETRWATRRDKAAGPPSGLSRERKATP